MILHKKGAGADSVIPFSSGEIAGLMMIAPIGNNYFAYLIMDSNGYSMSGSIYYTQINQIVNNISFVTSASGTYPAIEVHLEDGYYSFYSFNTGSSPQPNLSAVHMTANDSATCANYSGYPFAIIQYASNTAE